MKKKQYLTSSITYLVIAIAMLLNNYGNNTLINVIHILMWCLVIFTTITFTSILILVSTIDTKEKFEENKYEVFYNYLLKHNKFDAIFTTLLELSVFILYGWTYLIIFYVIQEYLLFSLPKPIGELINKYSIKE
jgi:hypothetical protein